MKIATKARFGVATVVAALGLVSWQSCAAQSVEVPWSDRYYDIIGRGILCKGGHEVKLYASGYLQSCTVGEGFQLLGHTSSNSGQYYACSSSVPAEFHPDGYLASCMLTANGMTMGHTSPNSAHGYYCKANAMLRIHPEGYLASCTLVNDSPAMGRYYNNNGANNYTCRADAPISILAEGYLGSCTLAAAAAVSIPNGVKYCSAGSVVTINAAGFGNC